MEETLQTGERDSHMYTHVDTGGGCPSLFLCLYSWGSKNIVSPRGREGNSLLFSERHEETHDITNISRGKGMNASHPIGLTWLLYSFCKSRKEFLIQKLW